MSVILTEEQADLFKKLGEALKKDESMLKYLVGMLGFDKDEPTMAGLLRYTERYIRTQHGLTSGSWSGETGSLELTIAAKVKQDKTTT